MFSCYKVMSTPDLLRMHSMILLAGNFRFHIAINTDPLPHAEAKMYRHRFSLFFNRVSSWFACCLHVYAGPWVSCLILHLLSS